MILLHNGTLIDGTGNPQRKASVLIDGEKIKDVGTIAPTPDMEITDCSGQVVAPGFIDVHSHADLEILEHRPEKVMQGVTSEVVGNCGFSLFPRMPSSELVPVFNIFAAREQREWPDAAAYFSDVEETTTRTNIAALTGHSTLRAGVSGLKSGSLDAADRREVEKRLSVCLEQGSIGLSTGLNEVPSSYGDFAELARLCRIVRQHNAFYTSHLRDYKFHILEAVQEALDLGRRTQVPVQISHLQTVGRKNWDKMDAVLNLIDRAHAEGVDVGIDAYPYLAGSCNLTQLLPIWSMDGGTEQLLHRLADQDTRQRIAAETEGYMANGWEDILLGTLINPDQQDLVGQTIQAVADARGYPGVETALDLLIENQGGVMIISFNQSEENLRKVLSHPLTSIITDGVFIEGKPHPRTFGTYPTFLGEYIREKKWMSLEDAIHKVTALPARRFRLADRGLVKPGQGADITVFSATAIGTKSNYDEPSQSPEGIEHVLINGAWALHQGQLQSSFAGRPLRN